MTHEEYIREKEGARVAVLCVHGILGSPRHFDMLLDLIPEEYSVYCVVLPGHSGEAKDFAATSLSEWEALVALRLRELRGRYERVYLVGHSLGTLLLLGELFKSEEAVAGAFLMAVPLTPFVAPTTLRHAPPTAFGLKARRDSGISRAWRAAYSVKPSKNLFRYVTYLPRFIDLFRKIIKVRDGLSTYSPSVPIMAVQSKQDELVARSATRLLLRYPKIDTRVLEHSRHFYYPDGDLELLRSYFAEFIHRGAAT